MSGLFAMVATLAFIVGFIIGAMSILAISNRNKKKVDNFSITKTKTEIIVCPSCGDKKRKKAGKFVHGCDSCLNGSFWV